MRYLLLAVFLRCSLSQLQLDLLFVRDLVPSVSDILMGYLRTQRIQNFFDPNMDGEDSNHFMLASCGVISYGFSISKESFHLLFGSRFQSYNILRKAARLCVHVRTDKVSHNNKKLQNVHCR